MKLIFSLWQESDTHFHCLKLCSYKVHSDDDLHCGRCHTTHMIHKDLKATQRLTIKPSVCPSTDTFQAFHVCGLFSYWLAISHSFVTQAHVSASGCCRLSLCHSVSNISFVFLIRVSRVSPRGSFSQVFFDAFPSAGILFVILWWRFIYLSPCLLTFNLSIFPLPLSLFLSPYLSFRLSCRER